METEELVKIINNKLRKQILPSSAILRRFRLIDEASRSSLAYTDPTYLPFYYYLGQQLKSKKLLEFGFRLGLASGCFSKGCKTLEKVLAFQKVIDEDYSIRLGSKNLREYFNGEFDVYLGGVGDKTYLEKVKADKWDIVIVHDKQGYDDYMSYLSFVWDHVSPKGLVIMDYLNSHKPANEAYFDFCKVNGREPIRFRSKYGAGMIER